MTGKNVPSLRLLMIKRKERVAPTSLIDKHLRFREGGSRALDDNNNAKMKQEMTRRSKQSSKSLIKAECESPESELEDESREK